MHRSRSRTRLVREESSGLLKVASGVAGPGHLSMNRQHRRSGEMAIEKSMKLRLGTNPIQGIQMGMTVTSRWEFENRIGVVEEMGVGMGNSDMEDE